ncbi:MAG: hypothetical protein FWD12_07205 [Alphaproteobacteria bacterium]|nr:hypothetical protein [Alphaproteobacteria bacterium]
MAALGLWLAMERKWAYYAVLVLLVLSPFILSGVVMWALVWVDAKCGARASVDRKRGEG